MANSEQVTKIEKDKSSHRSPAPAVTTETAANALAVPDRLGSPIPAGGGSVEVQASRLGGPHLHRPQRHALAAHIGRAQGNRHLQRVIGSLSGNGEAVTGEPTNLLEPAANGGAPVMTYAEPPGGNGGNGHGTPLAIQRREGEAEAGEGDRPTLAQKIAALAAAKAAEAKAAQTKGQGKAEIAKSQAKKAAEKQAGQAAKGKVASAKGQATKGKPKGAAKKGSQPGQGERGPELAQGAAPEAAAGTYKKAPASPQEDPAFQSVVKGVKGVSAKEKKHIPAKAKSAEAQAAAVPPGNEVDSKAQANQVGDMEQAPTPGFDAAAFKAQLMKRIEELAPKTTKEADEFKEQDKLGSVKEEAAGKATQEKDKAQGAIKETTEKPPDTGGIEPKPVTPLEPTGPGAPPPNVGAQHAVPKQKGRVEVEAPLRERTQDIDKTMAENNITDKQLAKSNEPEFESVLEGKKEAKAQAREGPQEYRQFEEAQLSQAQTDAAAVANEKTQAMHGSRAQAMAQVQGQQTQAKTKDEVARAQVAAKINGIYERTKTKVETLLSSLDGEVEKAFDEGAAAAKQAFEDYVDRKMTAYKEDRYGGWFGWARWAKDKLLGMPSAVNAFYAEGRTLFLKKMDAVIGSVTAIIARGLTEAKAEIAQGKKEIQDYVNGLPDNLKKVGQDAASDIQSKFDDLEQSVNDKQNELIDTLANKYQENLQAVDARIEELKAANEGLVSKVINAVVGVIKAIANLISMLKKVLAKVAHVVGLIIDDPIGFLGNLISAIKLGFQSFVKNIKTHLIAGLMTWLTGSLGGLGIKLPDDIFSLEGIFSLVMQVLGLTWDYIRSKAVKLLGEPVVKALETGFKMFQILKDKGAAGLWEYVKEQFNDLKEMVIEQIKSMIITEVIKAGVKWIMGLLNPVGAFIKAAMAIYDIVMFFVEKGKQIMDLINAVVDGVAAVAQGSIQGAAKLIEEALARAVPLIIDLLARLLGISGLVKKVQGVIKKIRKRIDKAIDKLILKAKKVGKKLLRKLGVGKGKENPAADDPQANAQARAKARQRVARETQRPFKDEQELSSTVKQIETDLLPEGLNSLRIRPKGSEAGKYDIVARATEGEDVGDAQTDAGQQIPLKMGDEVSILRGRNDWRRATVTNLAYPYAGEKMVYFTFKDQSGSSKGMPKPVKWILEKENIEWKRAAGDHASIYVEGAQLIDPKNVRDRFYKKNYRSEQYSTVLKRAKMGQKNAAGEELYRCENTGPLGPNHQPLLTESELTMEHQTDVAIHWNTEGNNMTQAERYDWYDNPNNLKVFCRSCNSSKPKTNYLPIVGPNFRGPDEG